MRFPFGGILARKKRMRAFLYAPSIDCEGTMAKICVIGAGRWGSNHIRTLQQLGALGGIVEVREERTKELLGEFPQVPIFSSLDKAFEQQFDGFIVATPAETHYQISFDVISAGYHVLIEKPVALASSHARELKQLAQKHGVKVMVGHVLLFHPALAKVFDFVRSGSLGRLQYVYSNRLNLGTIRQSENILWSFAPHDIAIFQELTGDRPLEISCSGGAFLQPDVHDSTITTLRYPNNVVGHIFVNWLHPFKEHRLVLIGSKGMISFDDSSAEKQILFYEKGIDWVNGEPIRREGPTEVIAYEQSMPLSNELQYFVAAIDNNTSIEKSGLDSGIEVLEILEKASHALLPNRRSFRRENFFVHDTSEVDDDVTIGTGTKIWHFSHIQRGARIGSDCSFGQNVNVGNNVVIGNRVKIQNNVSVYEGVELEDAVFCGPSCVFTNVGNPRSEINRRGQYEKTIVRYGATLGANSTIVCGSDIGKFALVGAGAVVKGTFPDYSLILGVPGRRVGWVSRHGYRLGGPDGNGLMTCPVSGFRYKESEPGSLRCIDLPEDSDLPSS